MLITLHKNATTTPAALARRKAQRQSFALPA
jgi:hypothetical protein